jgi:hypothetical protein
MSIRERPSNCACDGDRCMWIRTCSRNNGPTNIDCMYRRDTPRTGHYAHLLCHILGCQWHLEHRAGPLMVVESMVVCRRCLSTCRAATYNEQRDDRVYR